MADKPHIVIVARGDAGWLGGRQYSINLLKALLAYRGDTNAYDVSILVNGRGELEHYQSIASSLRICADRMDLVEPSSPGNRLRWRLKRSLMGWTNPRFEEALVKIGATFAYPFSSAIVRSADWLSDFQFDHYPDRMSAAEIADRKLEFSSVVANAQRIVLSSYCAERDCHRLFPQSKDRTTVLQFRVFADPQWVAANPADVVEKYHLPERFALISNWLLPTKNHGLVLEALARIPAARRASIHVVCTGDIYDYRNPGFYNGFLNRIHTLGLSRQVSVLGVIPKPDQIQLLRAATCYLQPSLFEGWNTGVEEARMFGKTMLISDMPVHKEQSPPRSTFFDPHDPNDLARKLETLFVGSAAGFSAVTERAAFEDYRALQVECGRQLLSICRGGETT
jgi:hypothetical protein